MILKKQCVSLMIVALTLFGFSASRVSALEQRADNEIPINELFKEAYLVDLNSDLMGIAWWIPWEYWKAVFSQHNQAPPKVIELIESQLRPVFILVVIQADVSPQTNFNFFSEETVRRGLKVAYVNRDGKAINLKLVEKSNDTLNLIKQSIRPVLSEVGGKIGDNFWLFVYGDVDSSGKRIVSPYEPGELRVTLGDRQGIQRSQLKVEFPLNSLFVPRLCPNRKPAHVSWKYCPWDGTRLSN